MHLNSIDGPKKVKHIKAIKTVGPIREGERYPLIELVGDRYTVDVGGVLLSYPVSYFYYN